MSEEEINVAIAECCGWTVISDTLCNIKPDKNGDPEVEPIAPLPNYCGDRNAVASIVNDLTDSQWDTYCRSILYIHSRDNVKRLLSSKQHAEALLRALGE